MTITQQKIALGSRNRENTPLSRDAFESAYAAVVEGKSRSSDQIFQRSGHKDFTGGSSGRNSGANMYGYAGELVAK